MTLSVYKGDDKTISLTFTDSAGDPIDITGYTIFFTVKNIKTDADALAVIAKTTTSHSDPTGGISSIVLLNTDTDIDAKTYYYDIQLVSGDSVVTTVTVDKFKVIQEVTERIVVV